MIANTTPIINCYLTDQSGKILNPFRPGSITYAKVALHKIGPRGRIKDTSGREILLNTVTVLIQGYIAVSVNGGNISNPIKFEATKKINIFVPHGASLDFVTNNFSYHAIPVSYKDELLIDQIKISINIETIACSKAKVNMLVPEVNPSSLLIENKICISANKIFDSILFRNEITTFYNVTELKGEVYQFNALGDGKSRIYTNEDELKEYGNRGILSPENVSYYNLFINGVLQPKSNYKLEKGLLILETEDLPLKGTPIVIMFLTFRDKNNEIMYAETYHYNTVSDGIKKIYTNKDEIRMYGNRGILNPNLASCYNLYINGVLQPKTNYTVKKGLLELKTLDCPIKGAPIILEYVIMKNRNNQILHFETYQYNALSDGKRVFTNEDELKMYGNKGIIDPELSSYQNLFVNGVLQPKVNYMVEKGMLSLQTDDVPNIGAPISLQYITLLS